MDVKEKQKFELAFNYIGGAMANAFEKASPERKKLILKETKNDTTFGRKKLLQERIAQKNGR
jgi:hypothetical protein